MINKLYIILILLSSFNARGQTRWDLVRCNCDSILKVCEKDPCKGLSLISDSLYFFYRINPPCLNRIHRFYMKSTLIYHPAELDFRELGLEYYTNTSFGKSMYKIDLLLWMRYYHCPDSNHLKQKKYGNFNANERGILEYWMKINESVDTSILAE